MDFSPACLMCGYSLVGLPDGRCPECGQEFVQTELAEHHKADLERKRNMISGWRIFALFIYSLAVLFLLALYAALPTVALLGFVALIAVAVREARLGLDRNFKITANVLLIFVAAPLLLMGIAVTVHSFPLWWAGYRWTEFDYPTAQGGKWLPPGKGCVLGPSLICIALAIPVGLWLLSRRRGEQSAAEPREIARAAVTAETQGSVNSPTHPSLPPSSSSTSTNAEFQT